MDSFLSKIHNDLGITELHIKSCKLAFCQQAPLELLEVVDIDFLGRPFILNKNAAQAWRNM